MQLADTQHRKLSIELRAYDDGVAFRYVLPDAGQVRIRDELTSFAFPHDYRCWNLNLGRFEPATRANTMQSLHPDCARII